MRTRTYTSKTLHHSRRVMYSPLRIRLRAKPKREALKQDSRYLVRLFNSSRLEGYESILGSSVDPQFGPMPKTKKRLR